MRLPDCHLPKKADTVSDNVSQNLLDKVSLLFCALAPTGTGTIPFDPTFGSFTLLEPVFILGELVSLMKVFRMFRLEWILVVFRVWTQWVDVQHLTYWQGQRVCDAFFSFELWIKQN